VNNALRDVSSNPTINPFTVAKWNHYAITYDNVKGSSLYFNGKLLSTNTLVGVTNTLSFCIGRDGNAQFFTGQIALFGAWERTLSQTEVYKLSTQHYIIFQ
jgi:hypothetical protein